MKYIIFVLIAIFLIITCYALCAVASDADERAEEMYMRWKNERSDSENDK